MAYHPEGKGGRPPIVSPFYLQWERYPYLRGPNYVRPMFRENSRGGAFRSHPIERIMSPLRGLGAASAEYKQCATQCQTDCGAQHELGSEPYVACVESCLPKCQGEGRTGQTVDCTASCKPYLGMDSYWMCMSTCTGLDFTPPKAEEKQPEGQSSIVGFFKDKSGNWDPIKVGAAAILTILVVKQYKKGSR